MTTPRNIRRLAAVAVALVVVALAWGLTKHQVEQRVAELVACRLPPGVEVADVHVSHPLAAVVTGNPGDTQFSVEAGGDTLTEITRTPVTIRDGVLSMSLTRADVVLEPALDRNGIRLTPTSVRVGPRTFAPDLLTTRPPSFTVPVPELPPGATTTSVAVTGDRLALGVEVTDPAHTTCP